MNFFIFCIYIPLVHSELHKFITTYTGKHGQTTAGTPEFSAVSTLDGRQIDYYDSEIKKLIPRQDWMKEFASTDMWKADTEIREQVQQIYRNNIPRLMQRFNQTSGVHTYQRIYGCEWDDETQVSNGFDQYRYDGEDFITLDVKNSRYNPSVPQAFATVRKWNNDSAQLKLLKKYYNYECIHWLKEFLHFAKATFKKTVSQLPGQSLTEPTQRIQTVNDTRSSRSDMLPVFISILIGILLLALCALCYCWKKLKLCKKYMYYKEYVKSTPSDKRESPPDNLSEQHFMVSSE